MALIPAVISVSISSDWSSDVPDSVNKLWFVIALFALLSDMTTYATVAVTDNTADNLSEGYRMLKIRFRKLVYRNRGQRPRAVIRPFRITRIPMSHNSINKMVVSPVVGV